MSTPAYEGLLDFDHIIPGRSLKQNLFSFTNLIKMFTTHATEENFLQLIANSLEEQENDSNQEEQENSSLPITPTKQSHEQLEAQIMDLLNSESPGSLFNGEEIVSHFAESETTVAPPKKSFDERLEEMEHLTSGFSNNRTIFQEVQLALIDRDRSLSIFLAAMNDRMAFLEAKIEKYEQSTGKKRKVEQTNENSKSRKVQILV
jgi:hypothetical protein